MNKAMFFVQDYGAVPNVSAVQTDAFQKALDACFLAGGGEVVVPEGSYVIGDIRIRSNTILHLLENAVLLGSLDPKDYQHIHDDPLEPLPREQDTKAFWYTPGQWREMGGGFKIHLYTAGSYWNYGLIRAVYAENIGVIGEPGSRIDGRNVFDPDGEEKYRGPHGIDMHFCKNVTLRGYTIENTGNWAHAIFQSKNITFDHLTVLAGHDALHTRACSKVTMTDCTLITGDDCIAGFDNHDVVVRNCEISSACSAFRYGGNNILVEDCTVYGPCRYQFRGSFSKEEKAAGVLVSEKGRNNMLSFWTNFVTDDLPPRKPAGLVLIRNCIVKNADRMLHLNLSGNEPWQRGTPPTDIIFENVKAENIKMGLTAYGVEGCPMSLTLRHVEYSFHEEATEPAMIRAAHCDHIHLEDVTVTGFRGDSLIRAWSDGIEVHAETLHCDLGEAQLITRAEEDFVCRAI